MVYEVPSEREDPAIEVPSCEDDVDEVGVFCAVFDDRCPYDGGSSGPAQKKSAGTSDQVDAQALARALTRYSTKTLDSILSPV